MKIIVEVCDKQMQFDQAIDGWFVNSDHNLAINSDITICVTDPWHADHICEPPTHSFRVVSIHK